jgi:hypothetical protein
VVAAVQAAFQTRYELSSADHQASAAALVVSGLRHKRKNNSQHHHALSHVQENCNHFTQQTKGPTDTPAWHWATAKATPGAFVKTPIRPFNVTSATLPSASKSGVQRHPSSHCDQPAVKQHAMLHRKQQAGRTFTHAHSWRCGK